MREQKKVDIVMAENNNQLLDLYMKHIEEAPDFVHNLVLMYTDAKDKRQVYENRWREIKKYAYPAASGYDSARGAIGAANESRTYNYCSTVSAKITRFVSILSSLLADPASKWFTFRLSNYYGGINYALSKSLSAGLWAKECHTIVEQKLNSPKSKFFPSMYTNNFCWFTYGTGNMEVVKTGINDFFYSCVRNEDLCHLVDCYNNTSEVFRTLELTTAQAIEMFGDRVPESIRGMGAATGGHLSTMKHRFFEASIRNPFARQINAAAKAGDVLALPYLSIFIHEAEKRIVGIQQYPEQPYIISRFDLEPSEIYGRSYVWEAMPDIKNLNEVNYLFMSAFKITVQPPLLVAPEHFNKLIEIMPRGVMPFLTPDGRPLAVPMQVGQNPQGMFEFLVRKEQQLDEIIGSSDLFRPEETARSFLEISQRKQQLYYRLSPYIVRLENECIYPIMRLTLKLLNEFGSLPPFPYADVCTDLGLDASQVEAMQAMLPNPIEQLEIEYCGPLAKMSSLEEIVNNERFLDFAARLQQAYPEINPSDQIRVDKIMKDMAMLLLNDADSIRSNDEAQKRIEARRAQQSIMEKQAEAQLRKTTAEAAKIEAEAVSIQEGNQ